MYSFFYMPGMFDAPDDDSEYRWMNYPDPYKDQKTAIDAKIVIPNWDKLDDILANFPNPNYPGMFRDSPVDDGRYRLGCWWYCFFERHWSFRGMTNALMDYYTDPESVHRLFRALTDFYKVMMERAKKRIGELFLPELWEIILY